MNVLAFDQFGKDFGGALETQPRIVQADDGKNLSTDFEAQIVAPLQILRCPRECQTELANGVGVYSVTREIRWLLRSKFKMKGTGRLRAWILHLLSRLAQRYAYIHLFLIAEDRNLYRVAGAVVVHHLRQILFVFHLLAVDGHD